MLASLRLICRLSFSFRLSLDVRRCDRIDDCHITQESFTTNPSVTIRTRALFAMNSQFCRLLLIKSAQLLRPDAKHLIDLVVPLRDKSGTERLAVECQHNSLPTSNENHDATLPKQFSAFPL